jgi:hypothetical protein
LGQKTYFFWAKILLPQNFAPFIFYKIKIYSRNFGAIFAPKLIEQKGKILGNFFAQNFGPFFIL